MSMEPTKMLKLRYKTMQISKSFTHTLCMNFNSYIIGIFHLIFLNKSVVLR